MLATILATTRYLPFVSIGIFSLCQLAFSQTNTCLERDVESCPARDWGQEFTCLMQQNTLGSVMNCISIYREGLVNKDAQICRSFDDGIPNNHEDYFYATPDGTNFCTTPRYILEQALQRGTLYELSILGTIRACPKDDPSFFNCMCESGVRDAQLAIFASVFLTGKAPSACFHGYKRATLSDHYIRGLQIVNTTDPKRQLKIRDDWTLYVDDYGRPVYTYAGAIVVGQPLPYWDQIVWGGQVVRRCYVHPIYGQLATCRSWWLPAGTDVPSISSLPPASATYDNFDQYESQSTITPTATAAPQQASASSVSLDTTTNGIISFAPTTITPNGAASTSRTSNSSGPKSNGSRHKFPGSISKLFILVFVYMYEVY